MEYKYILPPLIGAVIGWFTNYLAIKLLFRPHRPVNVLGYKLQGLIPKRRAQIAMSMASTIEKELFSSHDLASILNTIDWKDEVEKTVEEIVEHRFGAAAIKKLPIIGLVSENIKHHVKHLLTREILRQVERKKQTFAIKFKDTVDMKAMLATRIDAMDLVRFEAMLTQFITRELRHIERLGGVIGFLIGLAQTSIFYFTRTF